MGVGGWVGAAIGPLILSSRLRDLSNGESIFQETDVAPSRDLEVFKYIVNICRDLKTRDHLLGAENGGCREWWMPRIVDGRIYTLARASYKRSNLGGLLPRWEYRWTDTTAEGNITGSPKRLAFPLGALLSISGAREFVSESPLIL
ncbi:hypothetical protein BHYA_0180g00180 [Botrytis hyacinthi]|uniref:Uncharacterized protein n=1 Tax=Botrytis hyacinthi TaxID=278943 RepID=A0A4Z1GK60_9HELO|nr:hypothetical protein BHYA_0180g00180 [Botrytis hyacinthi]